MNLDMNLSQRFILELGPAAQGKCSRAVTLAAMDKAFNTMFGRPLWSQVDADMGRCDQDVRDLDVEVWNRALVKARDANYVAGNLKCGPEGGRK